MPRELNTTALLNDANLQGYWRFESGALGTDSSSNGYDLSDGSNPSEIAGVFGGAVHLDGNDYLHIANASCPNLNITSDLSVCAWVYPTTVDVSQTIVDKDGRNDGGYSMGITSDNDFRFLWRNTDVTSSVYIHTMEIAVDTWYFLAATLYDAGGGTHVMKMYLNGVNVKEENPTYLPASSTVDFAIGYRTTDGGALPFNGYIDDAAVFDRVLTPAEILALFRNKSSPRGVIMV